MHAHLNAHAHAHAHANAHAHAHTLAIALAHSHAHAHAHEHAHAHAHTHAHQPEDRASEGDDKNNLVSFIIAVCVLGCICVSGVGTPFKRVFVVPNTRTQKHTLTRTQKNTSHVK